MSRTNVHWSENVNFPGHHKTVEINADSYNAWVKEFCEILVPGAKWPEFPSWSEIEDIDDVDSATQQKIRHGTKMTILKDLGDGWKFGVRIFPYYTYGATYFLELGLKRNRLAVFDEGFGNCFMVGSCMFTGPVYIPMLTQKNKVWMSLTPNEILTLRNPLPRVYGTVCIGGLGMGWLTRRVLESSDVEKVVQVERNPKVIEFFGKPIKEKYGDKIEFIEGDIYEYFRQNKTMRFDSILLDIWESFGDAYDDAEYENLVNSRQSPHIWAWGEESNGPCEDDEDPDDEGEDDEEEGEFANDAVSGNDNPWEYWGI